MKKLYILLLLFALGKLSATAQIVSIPDPHFYHALLENGVPDSAGYITADAAAAFTGYMVLGSDTISNLAGIEAFTGMTGLDCSDNLLTSVNFSANVLLTQLDCSANNLTALDVSSNTMLAYLYCNDNSISSMDLSADTNLVSVQCEAGSFTSLNVLHNHLLQTLLCSFNSITSLTLPSPAPWFTTLGCGFNTLKTLDLSADTALTYLLCEHDSLISLNVKNGHNHHITGDNFFVNDNPYLNCIEVDNVSYSNANWTNKDAGASYSTGCGIITAVDEVTAMTEVSIYPNPVTSMVTIETGDQHATGVKLYNMLGEIRYIENAAGNRVLIDMSAAPAGIYFVQITDAAKNSVSKKIVKL